MVQPSAIRVIAVFVLRQLGNNVEDWKNGSFLLDGGWLATQNVLTCVEIGSKNSSGRRVMRVERTAMHQGQYVSCFFSLILHSDLPKKIILVSRLHSTLVPLSDLIFGALNLLTEM